MYITTVTSKGQATIPSPVRKKLGIKPGQKVIFEERDNKVFLRVIPDFLTFLGSLKTNKKYDEEKINKAIGKSLAKRHLKNTHESY